MHHAQDRRAKRLKQKGKKKENKQRQEPKGSAVAPMPESSAKARKSEEIDPEEVGYFVPVSFLGARNPEALFLAICDVRNIVPKCYAKIECAVPGM